jgi:hypothetical protein
MISEWRSGLPETPCGKGSRIAETEAIRHYLPIIVENYEIRSIADLGCGDRNWMQKTSFPPGVKYVGYDIYPRDQETIKFDVVKDLLPDPVDLILCIYVLNHLSFSEAQTALKNCVASGSKYLLMSNYHDEQVPGEWVEGMPHKKTSRHEWFYNLWRLNP